MSALVPFEGRELAIHMFQGKPVILAKDLGEALGYTPDGFRGCLRDWSDELIEDVDYKVISGDEKRVFLEPLDVSVKSTLSRAPEIKVLFESGFDLVLIKTEKPAGKSLRRLLVTEVLPKLRRGETIAPSAPAIYRPEVDELERARAVRLLNLPAVSAALKAIVSDGWFDERFAKDFIQREIQDATGRLLSAANQYPVNLEMFLRSKGACNADADRLAKPFGKAVKARFVAVHGKEPPQKQEPGRPYVQCSYYDEDRTVIEEAFATFALKHAESFPASRPSRAAS